MDKTNLKDIRRRTEGINKETLNGLMRLANNPDTKYLYTLVVVLKENMLRKHWDYPTTDPIKNAMDKSFYRGGDWALSILSKTIKNSAAYLDLLEESNDKVAR